MEIPKQGPDSAEKKDSAEAGRERSNEDAQSGQGENRDESRETTVDAEKIKKDDEEKLKDVRKKIEGENETGRRKGGERRRNQEQRRSVSEKGSSDSSPADSGEQGGGGDTESSGGDSGGEKGKNKKEKKGKQKKGSKKFFSWGGIKAGLGNFIKNPFSMIFKGMIFMAAVAEEMMADFKGDKKK